MYESRKHVYPKKITLHIVMSRIDEVNRQRVKSLIR